MTRRMTDAEFLDALDDLIVEDILSMTGDELRAEIIAEGGDPDAIEAQCRAALERAIRECEGRTPIAWSLDPSLAAHQGRGRPGVAAAGGGELLVRDTTMRCALYLRPAGVADTPHFDDVVKGWLREKGYEPVDGAATTRSCACPMTGAATTIIGTSRSRWPSGSWRTSPSTARSGGSTSNGPRPTATTASLRSACGSRTTATPASQPFRSCPRGRLPRRTRISGERRVRAPGPWRPVAAASATRAARAEAAPRARGAVLRAGHHTRGEAVVSERGRSLRTGTATSSSRSVT